jgi:hypothetical protein
VLLLVRWQESISLVWTSDWMQESNDSKKSQSIRMHVCTSLLTRAFTGGEEGEKEHILAGPGQTDVETLSIYPSIGLFTYGLVVLGFLLVSPPSHNIDR